MIDIRQSRNRKILFVAVALLSCGALWTPQALGADTVLVPAGATWKYLDNGSNQGTAWRGLTFNDSTWPSGPAQLGYGDGAEATVVGYGPDPNNKYITTYFRHSFTVPDASIYQNLTLRLLRDDGAVVYLNGTEVFRSNMPSGTITYTTLALSTVSDSSESTFYSTSVSPSTLVSGTNVLAVEVHQVNGSSSDISFDLQLIASATGSVTRGPYLQRGTPTSVVVRWRTNAPTDSRVSYGTDPGNLTAFVDVPSITAEHAVTLSELSANTKYYYSIGTTTQRLAGGDATHFFVTSPAPGTSKPIRIWVIGDSGTANAGAAAVRDGYVAFTGTRYTDLWLMLGDNAYPNGTDGDYQAAVFDMYPGLLRQTVLWPTLGNHDGDSANSATQTGPYYDIFTLPTGGEAGGLASGTEAYYSFDYGNIHFICLDSSETDRSVGGPMMTWLQNDLANTTKPWIIAFWHHPPYSKGLLDSDVETAMIQMRQNALPILEAGGVDLVLTGHSHSYERSFLLDGHYGLSTTLTESMKKDGGSGREDGTGAYRKATAGPASHEGAVYAVAGSSGQTGGGPLNHPAMFISLNSLGSMVLDINANRLDALFLDGTGAVRDYFTMLKGGSGAAPLAPGNLTATAASSSQINLVWTDNANNEDGVKIERSVNGSTFTQVATVGANVTTFADTWLSPATAYAYQVRAYNAVGDSGYSNQAGATTPGPPPNQTPNAPTALNQYRADGVTAIAVGGTTPETTVTFRGTVSDPDAGQQVKLQLELRPLGTAFTGTFTHETALGASGAVAQVTAPSLSAAGYHWQARTVDSGGLASGWVAFGGNPESDTDFTVAAGTAPTAPANLTAAASGSQINLSWQDNAGDETEFQIERKTGAGGTYSQIATVGANVTSYANTGLGPTTTYYYRIRACNAAGCSGYSNEASATTSGCTVTPMSIGVTVNGALSTTDCRSPARGSSYYADRYSFSASAGQQVAILLTSAVFDTMLYLIGPSGSVIAQNDDGGGGTNSRIPSSSGFYSLPASGTYTIEVTSYSTNKTGNYTLSLSASTATAPTAPANLTAAASGSHR